MEKAKADAKAKMDQPNDADKGLDMNAILDIPNDENSPNGDAAFTPPPPYVPKLGEADKVNADDLTMDDLANLEE